MRLPDTTKLMNKNALYTAGGSALGLILLGGSLLGWKYIVQPYLARHRSAPANAPVAAHTSEAAMLRKEPAAMQVRSAGPKAMRDDPGRGWDEVDQASDESFPSSDPPSHSSGATAMSVAPVESTDLSDEGDVPPAPRRARTAKGKHIH